MLHLLLGKTWRTAQHVLAARFSSMSKYGVESDNADKQPVNNLEWSLFNMNESLGVSYQQCHMLAVMLLQ